MRKGFLALLIIISAVVLHADFSPPEGEESFYRLLSPWTLGAGPSTVSTDAPAATLWNPAAAAATQRTTFDLSYVGIYDTEYDEGLAGHVINLGNSIPTKVGVFTWSGHYLNSDYEGVDLGSMLLVNGGFAKDVFEDLYVGAGLNLYYGQNEGTAIGATADLGFIHFLGNYRAIDNFRWGVTAKDIGLGFAPNDDYSAYPSPFTLQTGAAFTAYQREGLVLDINGDLGFPSFQNLRLNAGLTATFNNFIEVGLSSALDFRDIADGEFDSYRWIPSLGVQLSFQTDLSRAEFIDLSSRGWEQGDVQPQIGIAPLGGGAWGAGAGVRIPLGIIDTSPPDIRIDLGDQPFSEEDLDQADEGEGVSLKTMGPYKDSKGLKTLSYVQAESGKGAETPKKNVVYKVPGAVYLSPNNDGVQDALTFPLELSDTRYIKGYEFVVRNENGEAVRTIGNKEERPQEITAKVFFERLFGRKSGIPIPESLRWDGLSDDGTPVEDGVYSFSLSAWDDNGNRAETESYPLVVDNRPPEIQLEEIPPLEKIFSPNGDGNKDVIVIEQEGSLEERWQGTILNSAGRSVYSVNFRDAEPGTIQWDGRDSGGTTVPDGSYRYVITSRDRAGNEVEAELQNIIVDTQPTPLTISINSAFFSPNGDGIQDQILFELGIPNREAVTEWNLELLNSSSVTVWNEGGSDLAPSRIIFDGRSNSGTPLPEGNYRGRISARYRNGNAPVELSPEFILDVTPPAAEIAASPLIFSPNGDGNRDVVTIIQDSSLEREWRGRIENDRGVSVREFRWIEQPEEEIEWNGTSSEGEILPDGDYRYLLSATDEAGNSTSVSSRSFRISTGETVVALFTDTDAFSPNGDGVKDSILLKPQVRVVEGVESYEIIIINQSGEGVKRFAGTGALSPDYRWDGIGDDGRRLEDGLYSAEIRVVDRNGTPASSKSSPFLLDRIAPEASLSAAYLLFSPNEDGNKDRLPITQQGSPEDLWEGAILSPDGRAVRTFRWKGSPQGFDWLGRDDAGNKLPDGEYSYRLWSRDKAGNYTEISLEGLNLDSRNVTAYLTADRLKISPNGDGRFDTITFYPIVNLEEGVSAWELQLTGENGRVYAQFAGEDEIPDEIVWNGADRNGEVQDGLYLPLFRVQYAKGDRPSAELTRIRVDTTTPAVDMQASPLPFSPDNDGFEDELTIRLAVDDLSPIKDWSLEIFDRQMNTFTTFRGEGEPSDRLIWDGRSNQGELVISAEDYPFRFTIADDLGNSSTVEGKFPVDVLVIRDGDKLKIQIASIVFEPNSARFSERDAETAEKNRFVLDRIAEILSKYRTYGITIEGHANPVFFNDPARAGVEEREELQPLSEDRAQAVRDALAERGVNPNRLRVVGRGGTQTIADPGNREVNWKNRRVEFILEK